MNYTPDDWNDDHPERGCVIALLVSILFALFLAVVIYFIMRS